MSDAQDVAAQKVKQLIILVDKMEQAQSSLEAKLKGTEEKLVAEKKKTADLESKLAAATSTITEEREMRDVQLRELASTRKRLEEKTEVVNELLRNAEAELKMKTMAVQFAQDVLQHYDGQV